MPGPKYKVNDDRECFDFYPPDKIDRVQEPARDWANKKLGY